MSKRVAEDNRAIVLSKRGKHEETADSHRTSSLQAPNLILEGHAAAVYATGLMRFINARLTCFSLRSLG